jgi:hypothetical protein
VSGRHQRPKGDVAPLVAKDFPTAEEARSGGPAHEPDAGRDSPDQRVGMAREKSDFSAELPAAQQLIRVPPRPCALNDQFASDRPSIGRRTFRSVTRFFIIALIGAQNGVAGGSAWQSHGGEAKVMMVKAWASSLGWLSSPWQSRGDEAKKMVSTWMSFKPPIFLGSAIPGPWPPICLQATPPPR